MTLLFDPSKPDEVTNYQRTPRELEIFFIFTIMVAGKPAMRTAELVTNMLGHRPPDDLPRRYLKRLGERRRRALLEKHRVGQYTRIENALAGSFELPLDNVTYGELSSISGIGPKSSRFFILHSRDDAHCAVLDTHILRYLRDHGIEAPKTTPQSLPKYRELENRWLELIEQEYPDMTAAQADFAIWQRYSGHGDQDESD